MEKITFNQRFLARNEANYVGQYITSSETGEIEKFEKKSLSMIANKLKSSFVHLTSSCTAALEVSSILSEIEAGDEVIMPSFTFSSTANAVALRGGVPVFVDIKPDTLNIDERKINLAITSKTKAIVVVHYAGLACNMNAILKLAKDNGLIVIEDAAQAIGSYYNGMPLGTIGDFGAISFHKTKNIQCGEGGLFISSNKEYHNRAAHIIEKGTNRLEKINGSIDKYEWVSLGSSYVLSDIQIASLAAQLLDEEQVTSLRVARWKQYHLGLEELESDGLITRPSIEPGSSVNGHIYYVLISKTHIREHVSEYLLLKGISACSHYEPLHLAPAGRRYGRTPFELNVTEDIAPRLLRLPIWPSMTSIQVQRVITKLVSALRMG